MENMQLTDNEIEVLKLISEGLSNKKIAEKLEIEPQSVKSYVYRIRCKLGLPDRRTMQALSLEQIEAYRRLEFPLSAREHEAALLVAQGLSNEQIAERMEISLSTMEKHMLHIFDKLGVESRVQLTLYVLKSGWIQLEDIELKIEQ